LKKDIVMHPQSEAPNIAPSKNRNIFDELRVSLRAKSVESPHTYAALSRATCNLSRAIVHVFVQEFPVLVKPVLQAAQFVALSVVQAAPVAATPLEQVQLLAWQEFPVLVKPV
jgi:hypothetical protein